MATSDILGLFMSPEQYQAQQMAQQQAAEQQRAFNFAQLSPRDQAVYSTFLGAQQLGRGFGGLLGVQDPQLQRIRQRQEIMQSINPADMASLEQGILRASQTGDSELALTLADYARNAASNIALTKQRETEKVPQDIQIAARIRQLTADRLKLPENERGPIDAEIKRLERLSKPGATDKVEQLRDLYLAEEEAVRKAQAKAAPSQTVGLDGQPLATRAAVNVDDDPEVRAIRSLIRVATGDKEGKEIEVVAKATALADTVSSDRNSAAWKEKYKTELTRLTADKQEVEKPTEAERNAKIFAKNSEFPEGSEGYNKVFNTKFAELIGKSETAKPTEAERNATIFAKNSGFPEGSEGYNKAFNTKFAELIGKSETAKPTEAERNATIFAKNSGFPEGSEGYNKAFNTKFAELIGKSSGKQPDAIEIADSIAGLKKQIRDAKDLNAPEILQAKDKLAVLEQQLKKDKPNLTVVGEVESGPFAGLALYVDETKDQQFVYVTDKDGNQVRQPVTAKVDRVTSKVTATATSSSAAAGKKAFAEKLGALDAKDVESARANRDNAIAAINTLNELTRLNQQGVTSGSFAEGRLGALNLLNTLGLVSSNDVSVLANSQTFGKVAGDLILATLGGKLGAGFSNEDRKFIAGLVPSLETSREARQKLITFMMKKNQLIIDEATRLEDYARDNEGLKGFKPRIPIINAPTPGSVRAMSDDELRAAIKAKKGK
jgi:hypothetical protein